VELNNTISAVSFYRHLVASMWLLQKLNRVIRGRFPASRSVVYTCLFGYSEHFNDFHYEDDGIDFICFTDDPELKSSFWKMQLVNCGLLDPARRSKQIKALPHRYLPQYDQSLYIDNTVFLKVSPKEIFDRYLIPSASPLVTFRHPWRSCVYDEAQAVLEAEYDDPVRVRQQMKFYKSVGYPPDQGLSKSTFLLRRHLDPGLQHVMERWHEQVLLYSKRDQLSLNPVMWMENFENTYLAEDFGEFDLLDWPVMKSNVRVPRDFEDVLYRELNPDVIINGRKHYLNYGFAEGRRYK
jgi:hypothetical protein